MPHYEFRNVNQAFRDLVESVHRCNNEPEFARTPSRNGDVIRWRRPVIIEYERPTERVLFNQARDANPFFHLYESLWMLAGRNDLAPLQYYVSDFGNYSDDGVTLNGAYGYRWRHADTWEIPERYPYREPEYDSVDQLKILIDHLKHDPTSRRAVLDMWNVEDDLLKIGEKCPKCNGLGNYNTNSRGLRIESRECGECDGTGTVNQSKDTCCNLNVVFEIEERLKPENPSSDIKYHYLNMTVYNRSNDMIYGALGANVVHFSILQEYMAAHIGVEVGTYCQVSSNMHVYTDPAKWKPEKWLADETTKDWGTYGPTFPLVKDPATFDREVVEFVERHGKDSLYREYEEPFLHDVAQPMCIAFHNHKRRDYTGAMYAIEHVKADDWRIAARNWITKRKNNWEKKNVTETT